MKFKWLAMTLLLTTLSGSRGVDNGKSNDPNEEIILIARYLNEEGMNFAKSLSITGTFEYDMKTCQTVAIRAPRNALELLRNNSHIDSVDEDEEFYQDFDIESTEEDEEIYANSEIESTDEDEEVYAYSDIETMEEDEKADRVSNIRGKNKETTPYGIKEVQADKLKQGPKNIKVCVVDSGYDLGHEDLPKGVRGYNPSKEGKWGVDKVGHGTHVAGTIGAIGGNKKGVVGVNPNPKKFTFYITKGLDDKNKGNTARTLAAVDNCVQNGAKVINMSLGSRGKSNTEKKCYKDIYEKHGVLLVAAAGNGGSNKKSYPASYPHVMSVAAVNKNENRYKFNNHNNQVEISAPGVGILSTIPYGKKNKKKYGKKTGTSMATPHVAGVAALVWSHFPKCTNKQIRNVLLCTAKKVDKKKCNMYTGFGIVQAKNAYNLIKMKGCKAGNSKGRTKGGCKQLGYASYTFELDQMWLEEGMNSTNSVL